MLDLAKAMDGFQDGSAKSAAAMLLFGKTGATLLPFMKELAERGLLVTRETTANAEAAKKYEDNLITLKAATEEWKKALVEGLLPTLVSVTNQLVDGRKAYGGFLAAAVDIGTTNPFNSLNENISAAVGKYRDLADQAATIRERLAGTDPADVSLRTADEQRLKEIAAQQKLLDARIGYFRQQQAREGGGRGTINPGDITKPKLDDALSAATAKKEQVKKEKIELPRDDYTPLIRQLEERNALELAGADAEAKLTEAQKLQAKVLADIQGGYIKLTEVQRADVDIALHNLGVRERLRLAREAEAKQIEESRNENAKTIETEQKRLDQYEQSAAAAAQQVAEFGLSREELQKLTAQREADNIASLRQRAAALDTVGAMGDLKTLYEEQAAALEKLSATKAAAAARDKQEHTDAAAGAKAALKDYLTEIENLGDAVYRVATSALHDLENGLTDLFTTGKWDTKQFIDGLIREFVRLAVVRPLLQSLLSPLKELMQGGGGGGGGLLGLIGGGGGAASTGAEMSAAAGLPVGTFAKGDVFDSPTFFKFAHGASFRNGVMAEDGPESVMPLQRGPDGRLGVTAHGAGGGGGMSVTVNQTINIGAGVNASQLGQAMQQAKEQAKAEISEQMRRGSPAYR